MCHLQVLIRWAMQRGTSVIPKATSESHLKVSTTCPCCCLNSLRLSQQHPLGALLVAHTVRRSPCVFYYPGFAVKTRQGLQHPDLHFVFCDSCALTPRDMVSM